MGRSRGTLPIQLAGNVKRPGLIEKAFGVTLRDIIYEIWRRHRERTAGARGAGGRPARRLLSRVDCSIALDYEAMHGEERHPRPRRHRGVRRHRRPRAQQARYAMEFCAIESCGKCTPCRIGSTRGVETIDRILATRGAEKSESVELLRDLCDTMTSGSLCALGGLTPLPVTSALRWFPEDFGLDRD